MHLNTDVALDFVEGRLDHGQQTFWKDHLHGCHDCAQNVRYWQKLQTGLQRTHLKSASEADLQRAVHVFEPRPEEVRSTLRSIMAAIVFDSFLQPAMAGVRGDASMAARQLVMRADEFDIHIKIWGDVDGRQMLGQLLPRNDQTFRTARFHLLRNGEKVESTVTDDMGEFHFVDVPEGNLSLQIDLPNLTVIGSLSQGAH
jgi:hypothetical protein